MNESTIKVFDKTVEPKRITLARESRGMLQSELARAINVPQANLSKMENGILEVSDNQLERISKVLSYPKNFFYDLVEIYPLGLNYYRKNKGIPHRIFGAIEAYVNLRRTEIEKLIPSIDLTFERKIPRCDIDDEKYGSPEVIAKSVRKYWDVPRGAINNLTDLLESAGIIVFPCDFGTRAFSGVGTWTNNGVHLIFINKKMPTDRMRFTLVHELGHIVMHRLTTETMEDEANRFTSEFLMPSEIIRPQLSGLTIDKLAQLKLHWKVSMQSILMKANTLKAISERQYRYLWTQMGRLGYKLNEPFEYSIPLEKPTLLSEIITTHLNELDYGVDEMASFLRLTEDEFRSLYQVNVKQKSAPTLRLITKEM